MASLSPIPSGVAIVDPQGAITNFFRLRWQELIDRFIVSPSVANIAKLNQTGAIVTTAAYTVLTAGLYRVSYYLRKTVADGAGSSAQVTLGWTDRGAPIAEAEAALLTDTNTAQQSGSKLVNADANSALTFAIAYASTTPAKMAYNLNVTVEQLG